MRILLDKTVGDFADSVVKAVGRIQVAAVAVAKVVVEGGGKRQLCAAKAINSLPVVANGKQRGVFILRPQCCQQRSAAIIQYMPCQPR
jgi:hypothetical protein